MPALFIAIAVSLFLILALFLRAVGDGRRVRAGVQFEAEDDSVLADSARPAALQRIFARDDAEFVAACRNPELLELFAQERKELALRWVSRRRQQMIAIMRDHMRAARSSADLELSSETSLLFTYGRLRLTCEALALCIALFGPHRLHAVAAQAKSVASGVRSLHDSMASRRGLGSA